MSNLTAIEKSMFENLFGMSTGYVLDFSNQSFQNFVYTTIKVNILSSKYEHYGDSKAKRLREFWDHESDPLVGKLLNELLKYWRTQKLINGDEITKNEQMVYDECLKATNRLLGKKTTAPTSEDDFLNKDFSNVSVTSLGLSDDMTRVVKQRIEEMQKCMKSNSPLAMIFLCGSTLEGLLLDLACRYPQAFNTSTCSPKDKNGKVYPIHKWKLGALIDTANDVGFLGQDVKKFSHALRDFRNYIHPNQQVLSQFDPDQHTAKICWQVFQAVVDDLVKVKKRAT